LICVILCIRIWVLLVGTQPLWPIPALYLLEMVFVSLAGFWGILRDESKPGSPMAWVAAGLLLAFSGMAGFSVGFYFLPSTLLLVLAALLSDLRRQQGLLAHVGLLALAAIAQILLMLAVIGLLYPGT